MSVPGRSQIDKIAELQSYGEVIDHPSGYYTLSSRNHRFTVCGVPGFIAYRDHGNHRICLGGVQSLEALRGSLLDELLAEAASLKRKLVISQVPESQVRLFRSRGFTVNTFGTTLAITLASFSLRGSKKMKLRNKIKRAREQGVRIVEVGCDIPADEAVFSQLRTVSDSWLAGKKGKELDFMIGELGGPEDRERRIFAAIRPAGDICAFISYVPAYGRRPGYLHDLTRRTLDAPVGVMELCNAEAIERFKRDGSEYLHFGLSPFRMYDPNHMEDSRWLAWFIRMLERHGEAIYPTRSQAEYKMKWEPDVAEVEYVAFKPLSLTAILALMRVTRCI